MLQSIYLYLSMSKQMEFHLIFYYIIIWHLMRWYFDNLFLMRQLLLESKGASTYSLYPPAEQIKYSYRMGIRGVGLCKGNILQELENWGFYLNTLWVSAAGHPSGEVPVPARGAVIKSLRSQSVSGPNFIVIRQTAYPLG